MTLPYRFNRLELAGSLGDLGTLLPIAIGMILINGLQPAGLFFAVGLFYIFSGIYFGITTPVQPMKVIGAYAIAAALNSSEILAAGLLMSLILFIIGAGKAVNFLGKLIPKSVVRGVQLSTGTLLMAEGVRFMIGTSKIQLFHQVSEPYLNIQTLGGMPVGVITGILGVILTLIFLENKKLPAGLLIIGIGFAVGLLFGTHEGLDKLTVSFYLPSFMSHNMPTRIDFTIALLTLVLPQVPMTLGNAVIANADLAKTYFGNKAARVTNRALCLSMAFGNLLSFLLGGMPLCHGAGGLAAHYRFGARGPGSNLIIGSIFIILVVFFGNNLTAVFYLIPMAILGVLLLFAGTQLALTIMDLDQRKDLFVALVMLGITLAFNLAAGFIAGIVLANLLKIKQLTI